MRCNGRSPELFTGLQLFAGLLLLVILGVVACPTKERDSSVAANRDYAKQPAPQASLEYFLCQICHTFLACTIDIVERAASLEYFPCQICHAFLACTLSIVERGSLLDGSVGFSRKPAPRNRCTCSCPSAYVPPLLGNCAIEGYEKDTLHRLGLGGEGQLGWNRDTRWVPLPVPQEDRRDPAGTAAPQCLPCRSAGPCITPSKSLTSPTTECVYHELQK